MLAVCYGLPYFFFDERNGFGVLGVWVDASTLGNFGSGLKTSGLDGFSMDGSAGSGLLDIAAFSFLGC
jgi:hypothetical protein